MAEILKEQFRNTNGLAWVRTHGIDPEGSALCSYEINPDLESVEAGIGQITCADCIEVIKVCHKIDISDLTPEYQNELHSKRFKK
jgi:hypothetical protein